MRPSRVGVHGLATTLLNVWGFVALALFVCLPARATPKLQTFHIEAGDATLTLNEFSRQSSLQLLFDYNIVRGRKTRGVSGDYEPSAALRQMLIDTGLVFDYVNDRTLAVTLLDHEAVAGSAVAQAPSPEPSRTRTPETQSVAHEGPGSGEPSTDPKAAELEEIVITGTHVRGEQPIGDHVISLDREDINRSGAATVQDFLRTLPQAFGGGPTEDTHFVSAETQTNSGLGAGINLRGLGARATLILMNGKRLAPSGSEGAFADVANIPLSAIERVDILPDSASALYGSDAVGGVVNFKMRDSFTGAETVVRGGSGTQHTLREYQVAQIVGTRGDSNSGVLSLEFYRRDALPSHARRYATSDLVPLGGDNLGTFLSNPGNIVIANQTYAIPHGQNGSGLTASDFVAGTQNLSDRYHGADILPSQKRWSLYASAKHALNDSLSLFGNALVSQRDAQQRAGGTAGQVIVPASNPFYVNPAGGTAPLVVDYNFLDDLGPMTNDSLVTNFNFTLGAGFDAGAAWKVKLYANYAQEKEDQFTGGLVDQTALTAALADPNPATAFNPLADGSNTNPATLESIVTGSRFYVNSRVRSADVTADGPIAHLPGGAVKLACGADHRNQVFATVSPATAISPAARTAASRNVNAAFAEITVPLFGNGSGASGYRRLELSVAGRYEHYSDFGQAATPKFGMVWAPLDAVAFRGTWGRAIRAPTLADLNTSRNFLIPGFLPDSASPTGVSSVLIETGKNAGLTVERARSWTAGFDIDAHEWLTGLTFSATYFNIDFRDRIQAPNFAGVLDDPALANLVTRNPTAAQIGSACSNGIFYTSGATVNCRQFFPQALLDIRLQNIETVRTQGIDFNTTYDRNWAVGTLKLSLDGTYLLRFTQAEGPHASPVQLLDTPHNPINLRMHGSLSWQQRRWGSTLGVNFQNHYMDTLSEPNRTVRSYTTLDMQVRYELAPFATNFLQNARIELNAVNVFNASPPFLNNRAAFIGYDQENADPYGRLVSIQVRKTW